MHGRGTWVFAAVLLVALAIAPPAAGAMRWGPTETVAFPGGANVRVGIDARGDALAVWDEAGPRIGYAWRSPRGKWTEARRIEGMSGLIGGDVPITPYGTALLAYRTPEGRVAVATARPGRAFSEPEHLTGAGSHSPPDAAMDDEGNAVVGWAVWGNNQGSDVVVASRRAGRPFGDAQKLAVGTTGIAPDLAMTPVGAAAAGWSTSNGRAHISYRPPAGSFGPAEAVPVDAGSARPTIVMNVIGEVVAAQSGLPGATGVHFAVRSPLGEWGEQVKLDTGGYIEHLIAEPTGAVSFPFQRDDEGGGGGRTTFFATRLPNGTMIGPDRISSPNSFGPRIAMNLRGDMLGTWSPNFDGYGRGTEVAIAERPAGGRFGDEQKLSTHTNSIGADGALNDAGQAIVAWTRYEEASNSSPPHLQARVRDDHDDVPLPFPPDVSVDTGVDATLGDDGVLTLGTRCSESCLLRPAALLQGAERVVAGRGSKVRLRARKAKRLRVKLGGDGAQLAREALASGRKPWVAVSLTARGRNARAVTVSRRVRLAR